MLPAVKTMQAFVRATPCPRHAVAAAMIRRLVALAWLLALALPAVGRGRPAVVAARRTCPPPHLFVDPVDVTASGDGTALAWWSWQDGTGTGARTGWSLASRPPGATRVRRPSAAAPVGHRRRRGLRADAGDRADRPRASARPTSAARGCPSPSAATSGSFGSQRTIADGPRLDRPVLAANAHGDAAIAYFQDRGDHERPRAWSACGAPAAASARRSRSATGAIRSVAIAVGPRGDVLVAWDAARHDPRALPRAVQRGLPAHRDDLLGPDLLRPDAAPRSPTAGAAIWPGARSCSPRAARAGRSSTRSPCARRATASAPPSSSSATARTAARRRSPSRRTGRDASVAWTGFDGANSRVRVASTDPSARFGAPQDVSPAGRDGVVSDLAAAGGTRLVVWDNGSFDANQVFAALAPPGAPFGARRGRLRRPGGARRHARSWPPRRPWCGPTGRPARIRPAAWPPCRPSPRRRRAPA